MSSADHTTDHLADCIAVHSQVGCTVVGHSLGDIQGAVGWESVDLKDSFEPDSLELGIPGLDILEPAVLDLDIQVLDMLADLEVLVSHDMELVMVRSGLFPYFDLVCAPGGPVKKKSWL